MLNELCKELNNYFDRDLPHYHGTFEIKDGKLDDTEFINSIVKNQYFRITGSIFNDGIYKYTDDLKLTDELFVGSVRLMAIPKEIVDLSDEIDVYNSKYADSLASPYSSESFGGYSYSKTDKTAWQNVFADRLKRWRKI